MTPYIITMLFMMLYLIHNAVNDPYLNCNAVNDPTPLKIAVNNPLINHNTVYNAIPKSQCCK